MCHYKPWRVEVQRQKETQKERKPRKGIFRREGAHSGKEAREESQDQVSLRWAWLAMKYGALLPPLEL